MSFHGGWFKKNSMAVCLSRDSIVTRLCPRLRQKCCASFQDIGDVISVTLDGDIEDDRAKKKSFNCE